MSRKHPLISAAVVALGFGLSLALVFAFIGVLTTTSPTPRSQALAEALPDPTDVVVERVRCVSRRGHANGHAFNRVCDLATRNTLCNLGTGNGRVTIWVSVTGRDYKVLDSEVAGSGRRCEMPSEEEDGT
jgi:hypothetical protein